MLRLTDNERKTVLMLFKDFGSFYNANSMSNVLGISHVGCQKIFKRLLKDNILTSTRIGKSTIYKLRLEDDYVRNLVAFILSDESVKFNRWKEEFIDLFRKDRIFIMFGSAIRDYSRANDIDIMLVMDEKDFKEVDKIFHEKQKILSKKLHVIKLSYKDLVDNLRGGNKASIDIAKNSVVLYGQSIYAEVMKDVVSIK